VAWFDRSAPLKTIGDISTKKPFMLPAKLKEGGYNTAHIRPKWDLGL